MSKSASEESLSGDATAAEPQVIEAPEISMSEPQTGDRRTEKGSNPRQGTEAHSGEQLLQGQDSEDDADIDVDVTELKALKVMLKGEFTKVRRGALVTIRNPSISVEFLEEEVSRLTESYDRAMRVLGDLTGAYSSEGDKIHRAKVVGEMEKLEEQFSEAVDRLTHAMREIEVREEVRYREEREDSEQWGGEPHDHELRDDEEIEQEHARSDTQYARFGFEAMQAAVPQHSTSDAGTATNTYSTITAAGVVSALGAKNTDSAVTSSSNTANSASVPSVTVQSRAVPYVDPIVSMISASAQPRTQTAAPSTCTSGSALHRRMPPVHFVSSASARTSAPARNRRVSCAPLLAPNAAPFQQQPGVMSSTNVQGPWSQLQKISIPTFGGDKRKFEAWQAAFLACVDAGPMAPETKMLQLRQYLTGEPLHAIDSFGYSAAAYDAAKKLLVRKYGGERRRVALHVEELKNIKPIHGNKPLELERFVDLVTVAVINLKDAGRGMELQPGTFYNKLLRKFDRPLLTQYNRWRYDKGKPESVEVLLEWCALEAEFQTTAAETVDGLTQSHGLPQSRGNDYTLPRRPAPGRPVTLLTTKEDQTRLCPSCKGPHPIWRCLGFKALAPGKRWKVAKDVGLCYRCLGQGHSGRDCSRGRICGINACQQSHHRLLHDSSREKSVDHRQTSHGRDVGMTPTASGARTDSRGGTPTTDVAHVTEAINVVGDEKNEATHTSSTNQRIALRTLPVIVSNGSKEIKINALLDDGSTRTFLNTSVAAELGLSGRSQTVRVNMLNGKTATFQSTPVEFNLISMDRKVNVSVSAQTTTKVVGGLQATNWAEASQQWRHLRHLNFPATVERSSVDLLIGLDHADLHQSQGEITGQPGEPVARLTPLGWTAVGAALPESSMENAGVHHAFLLHHVPEQDRQLSEVVRQFWEIENPPVTAPDKLTVEEQRAVSAVAGSLKYENQRYCVGLPWRRPPQNLPNSYEMALRRLKNTEKRLLHEPETAEKYAGIISQYLENGYIRKLQQRPDGEGWYLPHFPVIRPEKETTKVRIVFDAAAKSHGVALNDLIFKGPKLQGNLPSILTRFRQRPVALVCDIAQMYLQIELAESDRPFQRFLWRDLNSNAEPAVYEFNRVVFGVNASPFLAQYVTQEHARRNAENSSEAAEVIIKSTYMDDSMTSTDDDSSGIELYEELTELWKSAGMDARKWMSNSAEVLSHVPREGRAQRLDIDSELPSIKTLGVLWEAATDEFTFVHSSPTSEEIQRMTKRMFLKKLATIFDPLGMLAPFTIRAKMLFQRMWIDGYDWDDKLPPQILAEAEQWFRDLPTLSTVKVPRCFRLAKTPVGTKIHVFADASQAAYGACAYVRHVYENKEVSCKLIASKTRVAPLSAQSIPRLEMMAAEIGLQLAQSVAVDLEVSMSDVTFWSDSMDVLWWIRGASRRYKPFIANRVGTIHSVTEPAQWKHVPTAANPADLLSRGMPAAQLSKSDRWWEGPEFLQFDESMWPATSISGKGSIAVLKEVRSAHQSSPTGIMSELEATSCHATGTTSEQKLRPALYSSLPRYIRVRAWVNRFMLNIQLAKEDRIHGNLTPDETVQAEQEIIQEGQCHGFPDEMAALQKGQSISACSKIAGLTPFLDEHGVMRCGGRLHLAKTLPYGARNPVILPRSSELTSLVIRQYHDSLNHVGGTNHTLALISSQFWIPAGREAVREYERSCNQCRRRKAKPSQQIMAPLPDHRVQVSIKPFTCTAVDFAGPFFTMQGRGRPRLKRYMCLFTCTSTRAVHIEMAEDLSTAGFVNALVRFTSRRGVPEAIISDNGTNFVGAVGELKELTAAIDFNKAQVKAPGLIIWHFNPPAAPNFGGVHESMIKSAKRAAYAVLKGADVRDVELETCFTAVEGILNSRPLTYQSAHPADDVPLTPNHFLHGQLGGVFAPTATRGLALHKRWRCVQEIIEQVWRRFVAEWMPTLHPRNKWRRNLRDLQVGDVVIVPSVEAERGKYPLGRVVEVMPGRDSHVRVVRVQTGDRTFVRPISKVCPLIDVETQVQ